MLCKHGPHAARTKTSAWAPSGGCWLLLAAWQYVLLALAIQGARQAQGLSLASGSGGGSGSGSGLGNGSRISSGSMEATPLTADSMLQRGLAGSHSELKIAEAESRTLGVEELAPTRSSRGVLLPSSATAAGDIQQPSEHLHPGTEVTERATTQRQAAGADAADISTTGAEWSKDVISVTNRVDHGE